MSFSEGGDMRSRAGRLLGIGMVGMLVSVGSAAGQERFEVGMDGVISYTMTQRVERMSAVNIQTWAFPAQRLRVGWPRFGRLQPQLAMAFAVADFGDISTVTFSVGFSGLYQITGSGQRSGLFVSAGAGSNLLSDNGTEVQWTGAAGLGARLPMGSRFAFRPAVEVSRSTGTERRLAGTSISAVFGFSAFTRSDGAGS